MLTLVTGALAGLFHVLAGPDHLAAVAPLAVEDRGRGWIAGWTWGAGHASGVAVVAVLAVLFRDLLPSIDVISSWSERLVGVALIGIGLWALRRSMRIEPASHTHGRLSHDHLHVRRGPAWMRRLGHAHASFYMGILHGVAGSSHFFGVLPALALPTQGAALAYIGAFGVGSVLAMTVFAAVVGALGARVTHAAGAHRLMMRMAAVLALAVGGVWLAA
jgi:threonine/homoserine/homoserine lactone efflux protein